MMDFPLNQKGVKIIKTDNIDLTVYNLTEKGGYLLSDAQCENLSKLNGITSMQTAALKLNLITLSVPKFLLVRDADKIPKNISFQIPIVGTEIRKDRKLTMDMSTDKIQEIVKQVLSQMDGAAAPAASAAPDEAASQPFPAGVRGLAAPEEQFYP